MVAVRVAEAAAVGADVAFFVPDVVFALAKSLGPGARVRAGTDRRTLDLRLKMHISRLVVARRVMRARPRRRRIIAKTRVHCRMRNWVVARALARVLASAVADDVRRCERHHGREQEEAGGLHRGRWR